MNDIEKAKWLVDFYQKVADGGEMQYKHERGVWTAHGIGPNVCSTQDTWRVVMPPVLTPVDMSVLVNSGIDCEFWDFVKPNLSFWSGLRRMTTTGGYERESGTTWSHCQPRMGYWLSARNFRDAEEMIGKLCDAGFEVAFTKSSDDWTLEFKITGIADNRCWPWEFTAESAGNDEPSKLGGGE